jgi:putative addiction module component (TIGR02574 family)
MVADALITQLLSLPVEDREEIVGRLSDSLPFPTRQELDAMMAAEIEDRLAAVKRGELPVLHGPETLDRLLKRLPV